VIPISLRHPDPSFPAIFQVGDAVPQPDAARSGRDKYTGFSLISDLQPLHAPGNRARDNTVCPAGFNKPTLCLMAVTLSSIIRVTFSCLRAVSG